MESITWQIEKSNKQIKKGSYKKKTLESVQVAEYIILEKIRLYDNEQASTIFLFSEDIIVHVDNSEHKICVGFYYDESKKRIVTENRQNMYCFFPTKEALDTCFIVHAPFLLTDNRQNLKPNEELNSSLIELLANLSAKSILFLRDYGIKNKHLLIDKNIVDLIPEVKKSYWGSILQPLVKPFYNAIIELIENEDILLSRNNSYLSFNNANIADPSEIVKILSKKDFIRLHYNYQDDEYVDIDFLKKDLAVAIQNSDDDCFVDITTYTISDLLNDINPDFLDKKDVDWVVRLYTFLRKHIRISHWKPGIVFQNVEDNCRKLYSAPLIHTKGKEWISFLNSDKLPQVFYAPKNSRGLKYSFVDKDYVKNEEAKAFLDAIGIKEPDEKDYIYSQILPKYEGEYIEGDEEEIVDDFERLLSYYLKAKASGDDMSFLNMLREKFYIKNNLDNNYNLGNELFLKSDFLDDYYDSNYLWVNYNYYGQVIEKYGIDNVKSFLKDLGVKTGPDIISTSNYNDRIWNYLSNIHPSSTQVSDYLLESFNYACGKGFISLKASLYLWENVLEPMLLNGDSRLECRIKFKQYRQRSWRETSAPSTLAYEFQELKWLYTQDGQLASPKDISLEALHPSYCKHEVILSFLGIEKEEKSIIELGGTEKQEEQMNNGKKLEVIAKSKGMSVEEFLSAAASRIPNKMVDVTSEEENDKETDHQETVGLEERKKPSSLRERFEKKWEEKEKTEIHHPHSMPSTSDNFDFHDAVNTSNSDEQPIFTEELSNTPSDSERVLNRKNTESALKAKNTEAIEQAEKAKEQLDIYEWFH